MGLLKKLLAPSPKNFVKAQFDPVGAIKSQSGQSGLLDKNAPGAPAVDPSATAEQDPGYYGDQSDPAYGSFTQPFDVEQFYKYEDPGYAFRLQQGSQAVQNSAAAGSGALSGAALKDLIGYNQDAASTEYGNSFNRYQTTQGNIFQRLMGIAGLGQSAAAGVGNQGTQLAGQAGQFLSNAGTASGAGIVGGANAITNGGTNAWLWNSPAGRQVAAGTGGV